MTIPDFQTIMLPLLRLASDGKEYSIHEATNQLADHFSLTSEEKRELLPSGQQPTFYNRVGWARTYLKKAKLIEDPKRGYFRITDRGREVLKSNPDAINMKYLRQFPEYLEFRKTTRQEESQDEVTETTDGLTPEEAIDEAYLRYRADLGEQLLEYVQSTSSAFFEKLVVELLVNMGYGGSRREAARAVGMSGDEGIDGIIDQDRLGLDVVYIQAKKWDPENSVGRPEIQKFVGALLGKRARKGVFITTSRFTSGAREYAGNIDSKVVLIDGQRLAELMIDYNIGVAPITSYDVKSIDSDYFGDI
ncbi:restriction endonuclease [Chloroflexota bacterium]